MRAAILKQFEDVVGAKVGDNYNGEIRTETSVTIRNVQSIEPSSHHKPPPEDLEASRAARSAAHVDRGADSLRSPPTHGPRPYRRGPRPARCARPPAGQGRCPLLLRCSPSPHRFTFRSASGGVRSDGPLATPSHVTPHDHPQEAPREQPTRERPALPSDVVGQKGQVGQGFTHKTLRERARAKGVIRKTLSILSLLSHAKPHSDRCAETGAPAIRERGAAPRRKA